MHGCAAPLDRVVVPLDEPSTGRASMPVDEVFRIMRNLGAQNVTMLSVAQSAVAALPVADHGYVLENGRVAVSGPAEKLGDDPAVKAAYRGG
jgi:branched-chain amino acid transport system ATP-binding protein